MRRNKPKVTEWSHCYDASWQGFIVADSFSHPAKFSRGLVERIYDHCEKKGYLQRGDLVGDPFGGVVTGGLVAAYRGYRWIGVELEPKFVGLGLMNIEHHAETITRFGKPLPIIVQGDSRMFHQVIAERLSGAVTSPPYADSIKNQKDGIDWDKAKQNGKEGEGHWKGASANADYGLAPGQIGLLKSGKVDAAITSPPYDKCLGNGGGRRNDIVVQENKLPANSYGETTGQIESLPSGTIDGAITSPPFSASGRMPSSGVGASTSIGGQGVRSEMKANGFECEDNKRTVGNIETLPPGKLDGSITSPPYASIAAGAGGLNTKPAKKAGQQSGRNATASQSGNWSKDLLKYGKTDGQISQLKSGNIDGAVTSPPWEKNCEGGRKGSKMGGAAKILKAKRGHGATDAAVLAQAKRDEEKTYGDHPDNIGKTEKETYWMAMKQVYGSLHMAIKPGGIACIVVKDYVAKKKRVCLCDDTCKLLEHLGFQVVERVHAMLVKETKHQDFFEGEVTVTKERKSFFRRLAEKKGSPKIDYEEVLIARRI